MLGLEKEVQEPAPEIKAQAVKAMPAKTQKSPVSTKGAESKPVKAAEPKPARAADKGTTTKPPQKNVKPAVSKPSKADPVKTKALPGKTPAKTRRA
jgi:hypothetical protein